MAAAAAAPFAEAALAESFAAAAPEMFVATESFIPAAGTLGELAPMAGMGELAGGLGAGLFGEFGGSLAGQALGGAYPSLAEAATQGVISGGGGAGTAGINEALIAQQQANAIQAANSGIQQAVSTSGGPSTWEQIFNQGQNIADSAKNLGQFAEGPGGEAIQEAARNATKETIESALRNTPEASKLAAPKEAFYEDLMQQLAKEPLSPTHPLGSSAERQALFGNTEGAYGLQGYDNRFMPLEQPSGLQAGFQKALDFAKENPLSAASMGYSAYNLLKKSPKQEEPEEYNGILTKYKMSPNFKGSIARPEDYQYTPKVYTNAAEGGIMQAYAGGGSIEAMSNANAVGANTGYPMADISKGAYATPYQQPISRNVVSGASDTGVNPMTGEMSFARGGKTTDELAMDYYERMTRKPETPSDKSDVGIYYDLDPDTRYLDPLTAAQIRMAKVNKRANMQLPGMKRPTPMGQINLAPPGMKAQDSGAMTEAAQGGIMQVQKYVDGGITGSGNLNLNIPLDLGGSDPYSQSGASNVYPFQNNPGFTGNNNAPQVLQQAERMQPYQASPTKGLGAPQGNLFDGVLAEPQGFNDSIMSDTFKGTGAFGGNPQQAISQLMGLLGGQKMAGGGMTSGGRSNIQYNLGGYAAGGNPRLLKGPGDGMSDNIPATIAGKQPARLADGEFVVPADVVSHLGNGSTDAGAKKLHQMMTNVRKARTGNPKQGKQINPNKYMPK